MKQQLAQLIEAYAAARGSGNALLQQYATQQLQTFLEGVELAEATIAPITEEPTND